MAPMAAQHTVAPRAAPRRPNPTAPLWMLWIAVSIVGAVISALVVWRIRLLLLGGGDFLLSALRYVATIAGAIILSGAQWLLLRRYKLDVYWWVPATVAAELASGIIVIPAILGLFSPPAGSVITRATAILSGALVLGASGLIAGTAQSLVLRASVGNIALAWIPATTIGNALAGAATSALSQQFFGLALPAVVDLSVLAATGSLLVAASQAPALLRLLR